MAKRKPFKPGYYDWTKEDFKMIEIHYIGHRKDIYEIFGQQLRKLNNQL